MRNRTLIKNACLYGQTLRSIAITNGKIRRMLLPGSEHLFKAEHVIDLEGNYLFPGLIDIHTHGCKGMDTMDGNSLEELAHAYFKSGTTAWLPTTMTEALPRIREALRQPMPTSGAKALGFHMEGPYINTKYKGAQNELYIMNPVLDEFLEMGEQVSLLTIAPELEGAIDFISEVSARGVCVSLGHTDCDYDTAVRAFRAGAKCLTHTCNAMPPLLHRAPGPIGAALSEDAYVQVISDGLHLHPAMVMTLYKLFGRRRMILISDSIRACGLPGGQYELGGQRINVLKGVARTESGALAGSTTTLFACVKQAIAFGIPPQDAFAMASETPAAMLGLSQKGKLSAGYDAEFVVCDKNYNLIQVLAP